MISRILGCRTAGFGQYAKSGVECAGVRLSENPGTTAGVLEMHRAQQIAKGLPAVLTREEVAFVLKELPGAFHLIGKLLCGSGLRLL